MDESKIIKTYNEGINAVINVVKDMSSHIDVLGGTINGLHTEIGNLNEEIRDLKKSSTKQDIRIAELEARLNKNSNNSSKPPSQDGYRKGPKNIRQASGRATAVNQATRGKRWRKSPIPIKWSNSKYKHSVIVVIIWSQLAYKGGRTCQVFDIPQPKIYVTEYVNSQLFSLDYLAIDSI